MLRIILPFPKDWKPDLSDEKAIPEYIRDALLIAQRRIPDALKSISKSNAFVFPLENTEEVEAAFLRHLGAIAGYGFMESMQNGINMANVWLCALNDTDAIVVMRKNT